MWEFFYRLLAVSLPTIRDFAASVSKLVWAGQLHSGHHRPLDLPGDQHGERQEHIGLDITIVTSAETDDEGRELLKLLGMPFRRIEPQAAQPKTAA